MAFSDLDSIISSIGSSQSGISRVFNGISSQIPGFGAANQAVSSALGNVYSRLNTFRVGVESAADSLTDLHRADFSNLFSDFESILNTPVAAAYAPATKLGKLARDGVRRSLATSRATPKAALLKDPVRAMDWIAFFEGEQIVPWQYIVGITTPSYSYDVKSNYRNGRMQHYSGFLTADEVTLTMHTDRTGISTDFVGTWIRSVRTQEGYFTLPSVHKKTLDINVLDYKNKRILSFRLLGCWPKSWNSYTLNSDSSILTTEITVSVDDILINVTDAKSSEFTSRNSFQQSDLFI